MVRWQRGAKPLAPASPGADPATVTREQVVHAARELYAGPGFADTTSRDIADALGTVADRVEALFPDPADLYAAVYHQVHDEVGAEVSAHYVGDDPIEVMRAGVRAWINVCRDPEVRRLLVVDAPDALGWNRWRHEGESYGRVLIDALLADAMDQGRIPEQPVKPLAYLLTGALESGVQYAVREPDVDLALDRVRASLESLLDSMAAATPVTSR